MKNNSTKQLLQKLNSTNSEERYDAATRLGYLKQKSAVSQLIKHLHDRDALVRIASAEALGYIGAVAAYKSLKRIARYDAHPAARGYAVFSLAQIAQHHKSVKHDAVVWLEDLLQSGVRAGVRIDANAGLYILGQQQHLPGLIRALQHKYYVSRCAAANMLAFICANQDRSFVINQLRECLKSEPTIAARSSMRNAIHILKDINNYPQCRR